MPRHTRLVARRSAFLAALVALLAAPAACGPRQVAVRTGESPTAAETTIEFTNNLTTAVNVYVRPNTGAGEIFLRQVAAQSTETIAVRGVSPGTAVRLRATPVSGNPNYEQENVVLARGFVWRVP